MSEGHSIICVDDDPDILRIYNNILKRRGYNVRCCEGATQFFNTWEESSADVILLDFMIPKMNGLEIATELRKRSDGYNVPIIFVSGYTNESEILNCLNVAGAEFICKPFHTPELLAKIAVAVSSLEKTITNEVPADSLLANRFQVIEKCGGGGFSNVYKVKDLKLKDDVDYALKAFDFPFTMKNRRKNTFMILREIYQLCKIDHPNIVKMYDFGQHENIIFVLLEYVEGTDLITLLEKSDMNEQNCSFVGYEMGRALEYLESRNMVHRDIKPDNIMINSDGEVKLVDFGLCKQLNEETLSVDKNEFKGTAHFVSPEYIQGDKISIKSDIYSLGITLYYMATKIMPFDDDDLQKICDLHLTYKPLSVKECNPVISDDFSDMVDRMLEKDPRDRPTPNEIIQYMGEAMPTRNG